MRYLTNHDLIWINEMVTGKVQPYNYVTLEACMAGQYAYGPSADVLPQAATLLERLLTKAAFLEGNRRTAFVATVAFLNANGYTIEGEEASVAQMFEAVSEGRLTALQVVTNAARPADDSAQSGGATLRQLISHECSRHAPVLRLLTASDGAVLMRR